MRDDIKYYTTPLRNKINLLGTIVYPTVVGQKLSTWILIHSRDSIGWHDIIRLYIKIRYNVPKRPRV